MKILVTGATGYIGSHTVLSLLAAGHEPVALDNLSNSRQTALERVRTITGREVPWELMDVRDEDGVLQILEKHSIDAVIHFAALKAVGESMAHAHRYFDNNVGGSLSLFRAMGRHGARKVIFSSSATIYAAKDSPCHESDPVGPSNPYGASKLATEVMLESLAKADGGWSTMALRYFNPVGAHESGLIGENPLGTPANLVPFLTQVQSGSRESLKVFGNDYPTVDGTGMRDYVHVMDVAEGHVAALLALEKPGHAVVNLGTGAATSVLQMVQAFESISGRKVPVDICPRRPGDIAYSCAEVIRAQRLLGWSATRSIQRMCEDAWRWQLANPRGYD